MDSGVHIYAQTTIIKLCMQNLPWKFIFTHLTNEKYVIMGKGTLNLLEEEFMNLIDRKHLAT